MFLSSGILVSPTAAVLFRTASGGTQILDEIDAWSGQDYAVAVFNAGFKKNSMVPRMEQQKDGGYIERKFPVYAPRVLAGIGINILKDTTRDRAFVIHMVRRTRKERTEKFRPRKLDRELKRLRQDIADWVEQHREAVRLRYDAGGFAYLEPFSERTECASSK